MRIMQEIWHTGIESYTPETHEQLVSKDYAREIWPLVENGPPRPFGGFDAGTCALTVIDGDGNMAAGDHSISSSIYGTGIFVDGVVLNRVVPSGSRFPSGVTTSVWLYKDGKPALVVASPSVAFTECMLQNVVNVVEYGMDLEQSVMQPRFGHVDQKHGGTQIEGTFDEEILRAVEKRGIDLMRTSPWYVYMGSLHGIRVDRTTGTISGVADPRRLGMAKGIEASGGI
jgi:gamma-glutamyltranspeptidase/glutathione hydrolase